MTTLDEIRDAYELGNHELVLRLTDAVLARRPGDDAAHEYRARAFLALGRADEAERHAADAVRLDPDEVRYRELLAQILSAEGAQLTLAQALARVGDARGAFQAATSAVELLPGDASAREALADAHWLADDDAAALIEYRALDGELRGADRQRVLRKAR